MFQTSFLLKQNSNCLQFLQKFDLKLDFQISSPKINSDLTRFMLKSHFGPLIDWINSNSVFSLRHLFHSSFRKIHYFKRQSFHFMLVLQPIHFNFNAPYSHSFQVHNY